MTNEFYTRITYGTAEVYIESGWYSRADIEALLKWFVRQDELLKESAKETK
jgi:hypothetical protein